MMTTVRDLGIGVCSVTLLVMTFPPWGGSMAVAFGILGFVLLLSLCHRSRRSQQKHTLSRTPYVIWVFAWFLVHLIWLHWLALSPFLGAAGLFFTFLMSAVFSLLTLPWIALFFYARPEGYSNILKEKPAKARLTYFLSLVLLSLAWPICENLRLFVMCGYPWAQLAWSFSALDATLLQLADIGLNGASATIVSLSLTYFTLRYDQELWGIKSIKANAQLYNRNLQSLFSYRKFRALMTISCISCALTLLLYYFVSCASFLLFSLYKDIYCDTKKDIGLNQASWTLEALTLEQVMSDQKRLCDDASTLSHKQFTVAVIHTNWPVSLKPFPLSQLELRWLSLLDLLSPYKGKVDLVLFPESVVPGGYQRNIYSPGDNNGARASLLAQVMQSALVIGLEDDRQEAKGKAHNALFCFNKEGEMMHCYGKRVLLPMGEMIPKTGFSKLDAWIMAMVQGYGIQDSFCPGETSNCFPVLGENGPLTHLAICYEDTFASLAIAARKKGAQLMLSASHDGWFPNSILACMHQQQAQLSAAVAQMPLVRSTHQGISGGINEKGQIISPYPNGETSNSSNKEVGLIFYRLCPTPTSIISDVSIPLSYPILDDQSVRSVKTNK